MRPFLSLFLVSLCGITACGGGGGGGGGPGPIPSEFRPSRPGDAGVAGLMDGIWRVAAADIVADPRQRNPDVDLAWIQPGEEIRFRAGRVVEEDDPHQPGGSGGSTIPVTLEFLSNDVDGSLTLYGFGVRVGANTFIGSGATRMAAMFGTTSPTTATAMVVQEEVYPQFPGGPVDRFMVTRLQLVKEGSLPVSLTGQGGGGNDTVAPEPLAEPDRARWLRDRLRATVAAAGR